MWLVRRQEHRLGGVSTQRLAGNRDIRFALQNVYQCVKCGRMLAQPFTLVEGEQCDRPGRPFEQCPLITDPS